jgi:hypothetical protein
MQDNRIMKRLGQTILTFLYGDTALYTYFALALTGLITLSVYQVQKKSIPVPEGVAADFRPYVRNFLAESQKYTLPVEFNDRLNHLTIKYGYPSRLNDEHDFVGWCELNTTTIIVEKETWSTYAEGSRQSLIDHELGHCLLERHHRPFLAPGNNPVSIMFPNVMPSDYYAKNKDRLYPELFDYNRANKIRLEQQVFQMTWINPEIQKKFVTVPEYLRFIESEMNQDPYQPWTKPSKAQVVQFDPMVITAPKNARQGK